MLGRPCDALPCWEEPHKDAERAEPTLEESTDTLVKKGTDPAFDESTLVVGTWTGAEAAGTLALTRAGAAGAVGGGGAGSTGAGSCGTGGSGTAPGGTGAGVAGAVGGGGAGSTGAGSFGTGGSGTATGGAGTVTGGTGKTGGGGTRSPPARPARTPKATSTTSAAAAFIPKQLTWARIGCAPRRLRNNGEDGCGQKGLLRGSGRPPRRRRGRDQARLPRAGPRVPPRRRRLTCRGGTVPGACRGVLGALQAGRAAAVRPLRLSRARE